MTTKLLSLVMFVFGTTVPVIHANPFLVAGKIRERPEVLDLGFVGEAAEAIIRGAEGIEEISAEVGKPSVKLNVLILQPRDYGFNVTGKRERAENGKETLSFAINAASKKLGKDAYARVLSPERQKELEEKGQISFEPDAEEMMKIVQLTAREGGSEIQAKSKTIFFLSGYGVPNRIALPWALILAKQGYQVVALDLPGFAKSGGKGPTYGKREVEDLKQLLSQLRSSGKIGPTEAVGVLGVSYGAGMASLWSAGDPRVKATVLIAPYARADETIVNAAKALKDQLNLPFFITPESTRKGTALAAKMLGITWEEVAPAKAIPTIPHPIHFITSPSDEIIPASVVKKLHQSAREGSTLRSIDVPHMFLGIYLEELEPDVLAYFEKTLP